MFCHASSTASHVAEMVKICIPNISTPCYYQYFKSLGRISRLCWISSVSLPSPCMCQSSTHLLFALHIKPGVNCIACLQQWRTCITPDYLPGIKISQCIPNCKTRVTASTCVTVFAFLLHLISICGCVIDRMPSGENNSAISINNEWYMRTEASNVPMYLPLSCLLWTLLFEPCWESIRAPSGL